MKRKDIFFIFLYITGFLLSGFFLLNAYFKEQAVMPLDFGYTHQNVKEKTEWKEITITPKEEDVIKEEPLEQESEEDIMEDEPAEEGQIEVVEYETVGYEYFDNALFIGDSRTVGIMEYSNLENATFYADSGMSVFDLDRKISVPGIGKVTCYELLENKQFDKIYLMIGINELGYKFESIEAKYRKVVEEIMSKQEGAVIYLCANMHITEEKSNEDAIYNNTNVNRVNEMISNLADNKNTFYIDVNELFDDENGSLSTKYSSDSFHVYGKYYQVWVDWLCTKGIKKYNN